jgi:hypothetical protein
MYRPDSILARDRRNLRARNFMHKVASDALEVSSFLG